MVRPNNEAQRVLGFRHLIPSILCSFNPPSSSHGHDDLIERSDFLRRNG
jgi:hypothetical protein